MGNDLPEELRAALQALADVQKRVNEYEAEKARLEAESQKVPIFYSCSVAYVVLCLCRTVGRV